jgi:hypothetical protein
MVVGLDKFRDYFAAFADRYVLIGGAACDLLFTDAGLPMRATKDLDIVLCVEVIDAAFATQFKAFLDAGGYQTWSTGDGERRFFRFQNPTDGTFPAMIEVFARPPASFDLPDSDRYIRLSVEEAIVSLSALLLNPDYYAALQDGREMRDGISLLNENLLIPFKARAYLDLTERRAAGEAISSTDIKKHRHDIYRLLQLIPPNRTVSVADSLKGDLRRFIAAIAQEDLDPASFKVPITRDDGLLMLNRICRLEDGRP